MHQHICIIELRVRVQGPCNDERMSEEETFEAIIQRIEFPVSEALNKGILEKNEDIFDHISIKDEHENIDMETHDPQNMQSILHSQNMQNILHSQNKQNFAVNPSTS